MSAAGDNSSSEQQSPLAQRLMQFAQRRWRGLVLLIPFAWLLIFFLAPFFIVLKISLAETIIASPPPETPLNVGDVLVVIGTEDGISGVRRIVGA